MKSRRAKIDIYEGTKSGFHKCCINWFLFRSKVHDKTGKFLNLPKPKYAKINHVPCPLHWLLLVTRLTKFTYKQCRTCNNLRLLRPISKDCLYCGKDCKHSFSYNSPVCKKCGFRRKPKAWTLACKQNHKANHLIEIFDGDTNGSTHYRSRLVDNDSSDC